MLKQSTLLIAFLALFLTVNGCGEPASSVVDTDQLSAEEAEKLRIANEEYEAYMNE
ncbi:hypothetical protein [Aporhodopirellula aestuarii]|uniref:Secreted protein n=1 Tax=Aporhodopirellula aestuarii TaxID=2950107 RepID=A0ABT0U621_9BACT|nr:hypothetical protein [Aporhodopirellula aestuarii]MCM2371786.1 hypothetical protein [Aporhodopirellula aestuarii]